MLAGISANVNEFTIARAACVKYRRTSLIRRITRSASHGPKAVSRLKINELRTLTANVGFPAPRRNRGQLYYVLGIVEVVTPSTPMLR